MPSRGADKRAVSKRRNLCLQSLGTPSDLVLRESNKTVSVLEAASALDISRRTVLRLIWDGSLRASQRRRRKPGSPHRVSYDSMLAYIGMIHDRNALQMRYEPNEERTDEKHE